MGRPVRHSGSRPLLVQEIREHWGSEIQPTCLLRWSRAAGLTPEELQQQLQQAYQQVRASVKQSSRSHVRMPAIDVLGDVQRSSVTVWGWCCLLGCRQHCLGYIVVGQVAAACKPPVAAANSCCGTQRHALPAMAGKHHSCLLQLRCTLAELCCICSSA